MVMEAKILSVTAVNKLYKKELFEHLRFEIGKIAEDAFIMIALIHHCCKVVSGGRVWARTTASTLLLPFSSPSPRSVRFRLEVGSDPRTLIPRALTTRRQSALGDVHDE